MFESPLDPQKLDAILSSLRKGLDELLGDQLDAVYLYGSQARGDARPDSDIDVLVVLKDDFDYWQVLEQTMDLIWKLSLENDVLISLVFETKELFDKKNSPLMKNICREGILINS